MLCDRCHTHPVCIHMNISRSRYQNVRLLVCSVLPFSGVGVQIRLPGDECICAYPLWQSEKQALRFLPVAVSDLSWIHSDPLDFSSAMDSCHLWVYICGLTSVECPGRNARHIIIFIIFLRYNFFNYSCHKATENTQPNTPSTSPVACFCTCLCIAATPGDQNLEDLGKFHG